MSINPLNHHYSMENPASIYDEEAMTALELAGRTAKKVNEVIEDQNQLHQETQTALENVDRRLDNQDKSIQLIQNTTVPSVVEQSMQEHIQDGTFDGLISEYCDNLEARVDNLLKNVPVGSTTMDAEVIDGRVDDLGATHGNLGSATRNLGKRVQQAIEESSNWFGVYRFPVTWMWNGTVTAQATYAENVPFLIPKSGLSIRLTDQGPYNVDGVNGAVMCRIYLGHMVNGAFQNDTELTQRWTNGKYHAKNTQHYIPYLEGVYIRFTVSILANGTTLLNPSNYEQFAHIIDNVKVYCGRVQGGGNLLGATFTTLKVDGGGLAESKAQEKWEPNWGMSAYVWKFSAMTTPLPLKYVDRVVCNPDVWMTARVHRFDPKTRKSTWVETLNFNAQHPCYGTECVLDFTGYGDNHYAVLAFGRVPYIHEYNTTGFSTHDAGTTGVYNLGLDPAVVNGVRVVWTDEANIFNGAGVLSGALNRNIELIKSAKNTVVPGRYNRDQSNKFYYTLGQDDFAGTMYGGGYGRGSMFYHVSPATYFTALLNPNSCAYGDADIDQSGGYYGTVCSVFCSLMHGYPIPLSTFDMRFNWTVPYFERKKIDLTKDLHTLKGGDLLTNEAGETGHTVMVTGVKNVGGVYTGINIMESTAPSNRESLFPIHNGVPYIKDEPEVYFPDAYQEVAVTNPDYDRDLYSLANWTPAYTTPQKVMCSRGYGSVYLHGVNQIILSVDPEVTHITITQDGSEVGTFNASDLATDALNGYNLVNITSKVGPGTIRVRNNLDDGVEEFHILDVTGYQVHADLDNEKLTIRVNKPNEVKFVNVHYKFEAGASASGTPNMCFEPNFVGGVMTLPNVLDTELGRLSFTAHGDNYGDYINVIFKTEHDTNTFSIDAQGDVFN